MSRFGFSTTSDGNADITPVCKYDARAGRVFRVDRTNDGSGWSKEDVDITATFRAVFDLENLETGWMHFAAGAAPSFSMVPIGTALPARPTPDHRNGIRFMVKLGKDCGGDVREMASTAKVFLGAMEILFDAYDAGKVQNPGKLPVVKLLKTVPVKTGSGTTTSTNYQPVFEIIGWVDRGDFNASPKTRGAAQAAAAPPATGASQKAPPPQQSAPTDDLSDFG